MLHVCVALLLSCDQHFLWVYGSVGLWFCGSVVGADGLAYWGVHTEAKSGDESAKVCATE